MKSPVIKIAAAIITALTLPVATASAHISVSADGTAAGGYALATIKVPHGCEGKATTKLTVQIPDDMYVVTPGRNSFWTLDVTKGPKAGEIDLHGEKVSEGPTEVTYTAEEPLPDGQLDTFPMSVKWPEGEAGDVVYLPVVQECEGGLKSSWIEKPAEGESGEELESPAPAVTLTAADADDHGAAAEDDGDDAADHDEDEDEDTEMLATIALILGGLALVLALVGVLRGRRK